MKIELYANNAKKHPEAQLKQIADSIRQFGCKQPIVVDKGGIIVAGHGRYIAMTQILGWTETKLASSSKKGDEFIPVVKADDLSAQEIKAYRLADNKLNESAWDMDLVVDELKGLDDDLIDLTGFSRDLLLEEDDKDDVVPQNAPVRAKRGEVWELGRHRLYCGDATDLREVEQLMGGVKADMVFTDPPYNVNYKGTGKKTAMRIMNDHQTPVEFDEFLTKTFEVISKKTKRGAGIYIFHSTTTAAQFEKAILGSGLAIRNQLIWNKPMAALGWGDYRWKHEPFFYAGFKDAKTNFYGDRTHSTIIDLTATEQQLANWAKKIKRLEKEGKTTIWSMRRENLSDYVHPTQKPVELITYALSNSSKEDDIIFDPFAGSGSTLIACEKSGRTCHTAELDEKFCDIIIARYEEYTNQTAKKLGGRIDNQGKAEKKNRKKVV